MNNYIFTKKDFEKVFKFSVSYFLDIKKRKSGRTSQEHRGLGNILDNFVAGKLIEIGVGNILSTKDKKCILDFDIKDDSDIKGEADIVSVKEKQETRSPNLFIEIKQMFDNTN